MHGSASWTLGTRTTEGWQSWVDVQDCQCCQLWLSRDAAEKPPRCNKNNLLGPSFTSTSLLSLFSLSLMKLWVPPKATPHLSNLSLKTTWPTWLSSLTPPSYLHWILSSPACPLKNFFRGRQHSPWGWWGPGTGGPEKLRLSHPWTCSRPIWMGFGATWSGGRITGHLQPCLSPDLPSHEPGQCPFPIPRETRGYSCSGSPWSALLLTVLSPKAPATPQPRDRPALQCPGTMCPWKPFHADVEIEMWQLEANVSALQVSEHRQLLMVLAKTTVIKFILNIKETRPLLKFLPSLGLTPSRKAFSSKILSLGQKKWMAH